MCDKWLKHSFGVQVSETENGDFKVVTFDETPIMSTYLLAFVVGEFDYVESKTENGHVVRVYTPIGKSEQGRFALEVAVKALPFYESEFFSALCSICASLIAWHRMVRHSLSTAQIRLGRRP